jgi:protein-S-isoprenylcysteine O-methyltransferase Ste14
VTRFAEKGGRWVVAQFALMGVTIGLGLLPPRWPDAATSELAVAGAVIAFLGAIVAYFAAHELGSALTPFPEPTGRGLLVESGPYRFVRHPIYSAGLLFFTGYALFAGPLALLGTVLLGLLWAHKASLEERLLVERYEGYEAYGRRVRWRLVPRIW